MGVLARKISRAKWEVKEGFENKIQADAVTADLKTTSNTLSFWIRDTPQLEELEQAVLAIACCGKRIDKIDIAYVEQSSLEKLGLQIAESDGKTPVANLVSSHRDIVHLDLIGLGHVANLIDKAVQQDNFKRFSRARVLTIITNAVKNKEVDLADLEAQIKEKVEEKLAA